LTKSQSSPAFRNLKFSRLRPSPLSKFTTSTNFKTALRTTPPIRPEIIANKGYETFGEHFFNAGEAKGESNAISVFEKLGVSPEKIAEAKAMLAALANK
jgi:hypothetical protein